MYVLLAVGIFEGQWKHFEREISGLKLELADLLAYNVYRAFRGENFEYPYYELILPHFYKREAGAILDGLKVWPKESPLNEKAKLAWERHRKEE